MDQEQIRLLLNDNLTKPAEKKKIKLYLVKKHNQHYIIQETTSIINKTIELTVNLNSNKKTIPVSLPKNDMEYVKAYDSYLETLDKITAENIDNNSDERFNPAPLKATIILNFVIDESKGLKTNLSIANIRTNLNKDFIEYVKKQNNNILPSWLDMLITDWNKEYINTILNISN